jgi:hypothetical protein
MIPQEEHIHENEIYMLRIQDDYHPVIVDVVYELPTSYKRVIWSHARPDEKRIGFTNGDWPEPDFRSNSYRPDKGEMFLELI